MGVVAIRIDERLIHGQVATLWQGTWNCNRIMVIDAKSANDPLLKSVLKIACPTGVKLSVLEAAKASANLQTTRYGSERIVIVTKTPDNLVALVDGGFKLPVPITVGNMAKGDDKVRITKNINVSPADIEAFRKLESQGYSIETQLVPTEAPAPFMPQLEDALKTQ